jgi:hypothetical protein
VAGPLTVKLSAWLNGELCNVEPLARRVLQGSVVEVETVNVDPEALARRMPMLYDGYPIQT